MAKYYKFKSGTGTIVIESNDSIGGTGAVGRVGAVEAANQAFETALAQISTVLDPIREQIRDKLKDAAEVQIEFGIKVAGNVGLIIASSEMEANFKISAVWKN